MLDPRLDGPMAHIYRRYNHRRPEGPDGLVRHPEWTRRLLDRLGRPDRQFPVIMVTGSKGKGSTAWYLAAMLEAHGLRTGFFASPHLVDNLERLRINGRAITPDRFLEVYAAVVPALDAVSAVVPADQYIGPVGVFAALACRWFAEERVDVAVFETGRGARFDDVAEVRHEGAVLTTILLEHRRELGDTREAIAWHKLGVVRPETAWVVLPDDPVVHAGWSAGPQSAEVIWETVWPLEGIRTTPSGTTFRVAGVPCRVPALAHFAADNARRALLAARRFLGPRFSWDRAVAGLAGASFPGRAERLATTPPVVLDGAVTRTSAERLLASLAEGGLLAGRLLGVVGVPEDKDWMGVAESLGAVAPLAFVQATNPRLRFPPDPLARFPHARAWPTFAALWDAVAEGGYDTVVVLGTQSLVADVLRTVGEDARLLDLHGGRPPLGPEAGAGPLPAVPDIP